MTRDDLLTALAALEQHLDTRVDVWRIVVDEQIPRASFGGQVRLGVRVGAPVASASPAAAGSRRGSAARSLIRLTRPTLRTKSTVAAALSKRFRET